MMAFICAQVFALSLWFHVASTTSNVRFLFILSAWSLPHVCCYNVIMFSPILSPVHTMLKNCICVFHLHVKTLQAEKYSWWLKILSCWWNWKISHKPAASPRKSAWDWNWNDFFFVASFFIISMFLSRSLKTINVIYNTSNTVPLPQNNWWYLGQESISSWIRVSSSSLKRLLLCWQLTHSGPPKVYPRNRLKEQSWSKKLCPWHLDHKHTLQRGGCFIFIHIEAVLFKCMAPKH